VARHLVLVYPGSRAGLIDFKLRANPRLNQAVEQGWLFVKFRLLRRLAEDSRLSRAALPGMFALDPLTKTDPQIQLL
jgi:hypothetical protein